MERADRLERPVCAECGLETFRGGTSRDHQTELAAKSHKQFSGFSGYFLFKCADINHSSIAVLFLVFLIHQMTDTSSNYSMASGAKLFANPTLHLSNAAPYCLCLPLITLFLKAQCG